MNRTILLNLYASIAGVLLFPALATAEPSFQDWIAGSAAMCSIDSRSSHTEMYLAQRDHGPNSKAYQDQVTKSFAKAKKCVDDNKPLGKQKLKDAIAAMPDEKAVLQASYSAWLGYMDWLSSPHDYDESSPEKARFEQAVNDLQASMDAR